MSTGDNPHLLLGRIRFLNKCIESFRNSEPVPESLCYVPKEVCYKICKDSSPTSTSSGASAVGSTVGKPFVSVFESPNQSPNSKKIWKCNIEPKKGTCILTTGEQYCNNQGLWVKISKEQLDEYNPGQELQQGWILACKHEKGGDRLVPLESPETISRQQQLLGFDHRPCDSWEQVVDLVENGLYHISNPKIADGDEDAVKKLRYVPPNWTYECDEDLVCFFYDQELREEGGLERDEFLGQLSNCVWHIEVSSNGSYSDGVSALTDDNPDSYWVAQRDDRQHWIRLHMKRHTVINKLVLIVNPEDACSALKKVTVNGGGRKRLRKLNQVTIEELFQTNSNMNENQEVCVLQDRTDHLPVIEIHFEGCLDGDEENVRIRGLKIESSLRRDLGVNADIFQSSKLIRFPRLSGVPRDVLYHRMKVIQRLVSLLDSVLPHVVPAWEHSLGTFKEIASIKQFFLLSKCRFDLISVCLKDSETETPNHKPTLSINRRLAVKHRDNPSLDPHCKNAVLTQIYEGLKPSEKTERALDYRWPSTHSQWWKCRFIGEGIQDEGGGFRDSLMDMSEELCPCSAECPVPLPFFTRTPNQNATEARDYFVPNPSCKEFHKYVWIGQLMGAALRGKDLLVLALPGMVWKQLTGETISWSKDFSAVDSVLVNMLEAMENMDRERFEFMYGEDLVYSTLLTDGQMVELIPGGSNIAVCYEDRSEFIRLVQKARLEESRQQIAAMRAGLLSVVPQAVLELLTWQEVQKKVCGDPEITVEALKQSITFSCWEPNDKRVKYFWEALANFTNEDCSQLLRFATGRGRLPAPFCIMLQDPGTDNSHELPTSSTCSSLLYLPNYTSAKACEEKLRYAVYHCVEIDFDRDPWEE